MAYERCRLCVSERGIPLNRICACTQMAYGHSACVQAFVLLTGQLDCELCATKFAISPQVLRHLIRTSAGEPSDKPHFKEDVYFAWSALIDRSLVLLLLFILKVHMQPQSGGKLDYVLSHFLVYYAAIYLTFKLVFTGSRMVEVYQYLITLWRGSSDDDL